jgi:hypothetical protein
MPAFRPLHGGNSMLDRLSHFLEGKHLDLPHALARDADFIREHSKWDRVFGQAPRFEDPALASVESRQGLFAVAVLAPVLCQRLPQLPEIPGWAGVSSENSTGHVRPPDCARSANESTIAYLQRAIESGASEDTTQFRLQTQA